MPRATPKGDSSSSTEMVDRFALSNGTAVQIHWPSRIDISERANLETWLHLLTRKILLASMREETGLGEQIQRPPADWREQRDRTKQALADRIVEVPKGPSLWDVVRCAHCGIDMATAYETSMGMYCQNSTSGMHVVEVVSVPPTRPSYADAGVATGCTCRTGCASRESSEHCDCTCVYCHAQNVPPPPPSDLRKYFSGCQCAECCANYRGPGTQYIDATMPGFEEHMEAQRPAPAPPAPAASPLYFQGCLCDECKVNRRTGALVWSESPLYWEHVKRNPAAVDPIVGVRPESDPDEVAF